MTRFMRGALAALAVLLALGAWWWFDLPGVPAAVRHARGPVKPVNVVILGIDTLRGDHLGIAGMPGLKTPNIDALAADGTYFARCQTTAPWTGPSFASAYTGLLPYHHGFYGREFYSLGLEQTTMAEIFAQAGYKTAAFVTVAYLTYAYGMSQGFQAGEKFTDQGAGQEAWLVSRSADGFTKVHGAEPFFLMLHYFDVHAPYTPPAPFDRMYYQGDPRAPGEPLMTRLLDPAFNLLADRPDIYKWLEGVTDPAYPPAQYAAGVSYADLHVGRVVADLKAKGLYDDTLIVLLADHGEHLGEHGVYYGHSLPYEEVLHVPLVVKWPRAAGSRGRHAGTVIQERVSLLDVLPTVLQTAGLAIPEGLDGRSLVGLVGGKGEAGTSGPRGRGSLLIAEQGESPQQYCKTVTEEPWKLMLFWQEDRFRPVLFNLEVDPGELRDLAAQQPQIVQRLSDRLWQVFDPATPLSRVTQERPPSPVPLSEEDRKKLKSLGYVH